MSRLSERMTALTGGNVAQANVLRQLLGPADSGSGATAARQDSPSMKSRPDLG